MMKVAITSAMATGFFCAVFAGVIDAVTDQLSMVQVIVLAGISGSLGSLFAHFALRGRQDG